MRHFCDLLASWGPLGVFVIATVESLGIPNPGGTDVLLLAAHDRPADERCLCAAAGGARVADRNARSFFEIMRQGRRAVPAERTHLPAGAPDSGPGFCATAW